MTFNTVMTQVSKFNTIEMAQSYVDRNAKTLFIVLGDNCEYWVATYRYAAWLVKNGYQMMEA